MTIKDVPLEGKAPTNEVDVVVATNQVASPYVESSYQPYVNNNDYNRNNNNGTIPMVAATVVADNSSPLNYANDPIPKPNTSIETSTNYPAVDNAAMVTTDPPVQQNPMGQGTPLPAGARWITIKHIGGVTWTLCTLVSILTCCFVLCPCGLWAFACPCDEIRAYEVNGQVYDEHGRPLGHISKFRVL